MSVVTRCRSCTSTALRTLLSHSAAATTRSRRTARRVFYSTSCTMQVLALLCDPFPLAHSLSPVAPWHVARGPWHVVRGPWPVAHFPMCHSCQSIITSMSGLGPAFAPFPNVPDFVEAWRARNGVNGSSPVRGFSNGSVSCNSWASDSFSNVTLCVAEGEGHAWPGATHLCRDPMFKCTLDMDATAHIAAFFGAFFAAAVKQ